MRNGWTREEDSILIGNYPLLSDAEISALLNRSDKAVKCRRFDLGLVQRHASGGRRKGQSCIDMRMAAKPFICKPFPKGYRPSHIDFAFPDDLKRHVDLIKRVYGTYGGGR